MHRDSCAARWNDEGGGEEALSCSDVLEVGDKSLPWAEGLVFQWLQRPQFGAGLADRSDVDD